MRSTETGLFSQEVYELDVAKSSSAGHSVKNFVTSGGDLALDASWHRLTHLPHRIALSFLATGDYLAHMSLDATARRRWLGVLVLLAALVMLVAGQTVLQNRLKDLVFLGYWFLCLLLTATAIVIAFLDARALRRQTRDEARDLLQATLKEIESEAKNRPRRRGDPGNC